MFKERREELGWTLDDVAAKTRVAKFYLKAIEIEDFSKLPAEVYTKGYIRSYAKLLGIPPEQALSEYEKYLKTKKAEEERNLSEPIQSPLSFYRRHFKKIVWLAPLFILLFVYLVVSQQRYTVPVTQMSGIVSNAQKTEENILLNSSVKDKGLSVNSTLDMTSKKKHKLNMIATDKVWLQIIIDGVDKKELLLNKGESVSYFANESFKILIGNAGGIKLIYNGKEIENIGSSGQVIRLSLPSTDLLNAPPKSPM